MVYQAKYSIKMTSNTVRNYINNDKSDIFDF